MALKLITPPATDPISLVEAKGHLRVDHSDDDATITFLIKTATQYVDAVSGWHGRALITQTWDLVIDQFPVPMWSWCQCSAGMAGAALQMPFPPLQSVTSIKYIDVNGVQQTMPSTDYFVDTVSKPGWVIPLTSWPSSKAVANAIEVRFVCGYGNNGSDVDAPIREALLLLIGHLYENREQVVVQPEGGATVLMLPLGFFELLSPTRQILV